jgi:hypothetical protein
MHASNCCLGVETLVTPDGRQLEQMATLCQETGDAYEEVIGLLIC